MTDTHRPTAEEIEQLVEQVRRDPGAPAFIALGDAMLALGRPREAVDVGAAGLQANPDSIEGRLMVGRAHVMLHQWKEAQVELLKIVKVDRANIDGFRLLGEVLLRRADYERALPVLQHAQNLDPANHEVLVLLKRAREGKPLDPPLPVPTPLAPASSAARPGHTTAPARPSAGRAAVAPPPPRPGPVPRAPGLPPPRPQPGPFDDDPTRLNEDPAPYGRESTAMGARYAPTEPAHGFGEGDATAVPTSFADAAGRRPKPPLPRPGASAQMPAATAAATSQASEPIARAAPPPKAPAGSRPRPPSPMAEPVAAAPTLGPAAMPTQVATAMAVVMPGAMGVRPRVLPAEKPKDAAHASLRQSAAVGENYLNNLLTAGLLDVPNVRVPDSNFDVKPGKRWGRSSTRAFVALFVLLVGGAAGGYTWYYYGEKERSEDVAAHQLAAQEQMTSATFEAYVGALAEIDKALARDDGNAYSIALYAHASALQALLYGMPTGKTEVAIATAQARITKPDHAGWRDLLVARAAMRLATLAEQENPVKLLADVRADLAAWLADHADDGVVRWLEGRALLLGGDRSGALAALVAAGEGAAPPVQAIVDRADLLLDDGAYDEAMKLYGRALEVVPDHPLAILGRALGRAERSVDTEANETDLSVKLDKDRGPRIAGYRALASSYSKYALDDFPRFDEELDRAIGSTEPRFLARVALGRVRQGKLADALATRNRIAWYGDGAPQPDPLVALVDAELKLAIGVPARALETLGAVDGLAAAIVRGRALLALGKAADAFTALDAALAQAPANLELQVWREAARLIARTGKERTEANDALDKLGRRSKSKVARHAHGMALLAIGNAKDAERKLELALEDITAEEPHPQAYATHTLLAQIAFARGGEAEAVAANLDVAKKHLEAALNGNPGYLPATGLLGLVLLRLGDAQGAAERLALVVKESEIATAAMDLAYAEAIVSRSSVTQAERDLAAAAVRAAKEKGISSADLARVAPLVDPELATELDVPAAAPEKKKRGR